MNLRDSLYWNKEFEMGLPDCRLAGKPTIVRARMLWEQVFCANCGCDGGLVTAEWTPHVFYLCDACASLGPLEFHQVDENLVRGI